MKVFNDTKSMRATHLIKILQEQTLLRSYCGNNTDSIEKQCNALKSFVQDLFLLDHFPLNCYFYGKAILCVYMI